MRTRAVREGSVGLLFLLGLGLFVGLFLWLRGLTLGARSYNIAIEFPRVNGLQEGAAVRYRGVTVGNITALRPQRNGVEVDVEITPANLLIARDVLVEANQSGFLGEVSVDITPQSELPEEEAIAKPLAPNCDRQLIVCNGSRLKGQIGVSTDELIRFSTRFASVYSNQELYDNVNTAIKNTSITAAEVSQLTRELSALTKVTRQQLGRLDDVVNQVSATTTKTATQFGATADQVRLTAAQANRLLVNLNSLVTANRSSLVTALNNLTETSQQLRSTVQTLTPTVNRVTQGDLIKNLETLTANAAQASVNLRDVSNNLNNPNNLLVLQQTLDSARVTFQNAQKITSDLDELTGDPAFRKNVRELVNGLSSLVSSTQELQQQVQVAQTLDSVTANVKQAKTKTLGLGPSAQAVPQISTWDWANFSATGTNQQPINYPAGTRKKIGEQLDGKLTPQWLLQLKAKGASPQEKGEK
jgi:phospholipid/cholesterol/gamma-HCH transport system substrate-binding protein